MKLNHLTDKTLLSTMISLAQKERALLIELLWHLREIDRRKLYSEARCGSLFEYCVKILKYSEAAASRRVTACRLLKEMPELAKEIQAGEINLTQMNQAKSFFNEMGMTEIKDKKKIINDIKGKSSKETERILWEKRDSDSPRKISISLNEETIEVLQKLKGLKAHSCADYDSLIMKMAELAVKEWDPGVVHRKRALGKGDSRYIQTGVKAAIWERDRGRCVHCSSTYALQVDHIKPFALGGKSNVENLRLLCRNCNQKKGKEVFGDRSYTY